MCVWWIFQLCQWMCYVPVDGYEPEGSNYSPREAKAVSAGWAEKALSLSSVCGGVIKERACPALWEGGSVARCVCSC